MSDEGKAFEKEKNCYCHTCHRSFSWLGIARHRAMHRDKKEDCKITFTHGDTYTYLYSKNKPVLGEEEWK